MFPAPNGFLSQNVSSALCFLHTSVRVKNACKPGFYVKKKFSNKTIFEIVFTLHYNYKSLIYNNNNNNIFKARLTYNNAYPIKPQKLSKNQQIVTI